MKKDKRYGGRQENNMIAALDKMKAFEAFQELILPTIRKDLAAGLTAEEILKKHAHLAAARLVTTAITNTDPGKATAAAKEVLDRAHGKATEKREVTHKLDKLPDDQLDALLLTELEDMDNPPVSKQIRAPKKKRGRPTKGEALQKKFQDNDGQEPA